MRRYKRDLRKLAIKDEYAGSPVAQKWSWCVENDIKLHAIVIYRPKKRFWKARCIWHTLGHDTTEPIAPLRAVERVTGFIADCVRPDAIDKNPYRDKV
jgi:hypothetical protein